MRAKCFFLLATLGTLPLLAACGGGEVTVRVMQGDEEGEAQPVADLPVQFLPFNRDSIFEALAQTAEEPEPEIPDDLRTSFDSVQQLQGRWREAETRWTQVRDSLRMLSDRLRGMDARGSDYRRLYERFNQLESREAGLARTKNQAFARFDSLQKAALGRADSVRAVRDAWSEVAFQEYTTIVDSILEAQGAEIRDDTTGAEGYAEASLSGDEWWVYTRMDVPFGELYWNVPIRPAETDTLILDAGNAERRLRL